MLWLVTADGCVLGWTQDLLPKAEDSPESSTTEEVKDDQEERRMMEELQRQTYLEDQKILENEEEMMRIAMAESLNPSQN